MVMSMEKRESTDRNEGKDLAWFLGLAFGIAWGGEGLLIILYGLGILPEQGSAIHYICIALLCGMAPTYAALIVKHCRRGLTLKQIIKNDCSLKNVRLSFAMLGIFFILQIVVNQLLENRTDFSWILSPIALIVMIFGGGLEEVGWRGIMQPVFFKKLPFAAAAAIQGVLWALWHLPLWFVPNTSQSGMSFMAFLTYCVAFCFALSVLYRITESVAACVLLHAWGNTCQMLFTMNTLQEAPSYRALAVFAGWIAASLLVCRLVICGMKYIENKKFV